MPARLHEDAQRFNLSNERGVDGTTRLLRNVMGLWLLQESLRGWALSAPGASLESLLGEVDAMVVVGYDMPVAANVVSNRKMLALALGMGMLLALTRLTTIR